MCTKTYVFSNKKVRQRANNPKIAPDRTFFGGNRYTFEHSKSYTQLCCFRAQMCTPASKPRKFARNCVVFGPKCARRRVNLANLHASVLDFRENQHTCVHSAFRREIGYSCLSIFKSKRGISFDLEIPRKTFNCCCYYLFHSKNA